MNKGIEHVDISAANPGYHNPVVKFDLDLDGLSRRDSESSMITGTFQFFALDLLIKRPLGDMVQPLYRHDAESFAWCLIYICNCMGKDDNGEIGTLIPHPLSSWSTSVSESHYSKYMLNNK